MTQLGITAKDWKPSTAQGSLLGFLTICIPVGVGTLQIQGCRYFYDTTKPAGRQEWVSFPERPYQSDGQTKYAKIIWTEPRALSDQIRDESARAANDLYQRGGDQPQGGRGGRW